MQKLVDQYGSNRVYIVGLDVLEYPPTWVHGSGEVERISQALEKNHGSNGSPGRNE